MDKLLGDRDTPGYQANHADNQTRYADLSIREFDMIQIYAKGDMMT